MLFEVGHLAHDAVVAYDKVLLLQASNGTAVPAGDIGMNRLYIPGEVSSTPARTTGSSAAQQQGALDACGWCKDKWGVSWQITPRVLIDALAKGGEVARRAFEAMMPMQKIDIAAIEAAIRG